MSVDTAKAIGDQKGMIKSLDDYAANLESLGKHAFAAPYRSLQLIEDALDGQPMRHLRKLVPVNELRTIGAFLAH